jgi:hypothetical protein
MTQIRTGNVILWVDFLYKPCSFLAVYEETSQNQIMTLQWQGSRRDLQKSLQISQSYSQNNMYKTKLQELL